MRLSINTKSNIFFKHKKTPYEWDKNVPTVQTTEIINNYFLDPYLSYEDRKAS